jgi:hypothetical protein
MKFHPFAFSLVLTIATVATLPQAASASSHFKTATHPTLSEVGTLDNSNPAPPSPVITQNPDQVKVPTHPTLSEVGTADHRNSANQGSASAPNSPSFKTPTHPTLSEL